MHLLVVGIRHPASADCNEERIFFDGGPGFCLRPVDTPPPGGDGWVLAEWVVGFKFVGTRVVSTMEIFGEIFGVLYIETHRHRSKKFYVFSIP